MYRAKEIIESIETALRIDERNIFNMDDVNQFLDKWESKARRPETKKWIKGVLKKHVINVYDKADPLNRIEADAYLAKRLNLTNIPELLSNAPQWMKDAYSNEELYYLYISPESMVNSNTQIGLSFLEQDIDLIIDYFDSPDGPKRPESILYYDACEKSRNWEDSLKKEFRDREDPTEVKVIKEVGNYKWVQILGKTGLDREGDEMHHCLSAKTYGDDCTYYSLRDEKNKPHATFEIQDMTTLLQLKGYNNGPIEPHLKNVVSDFIEYLVGYRSLEFVDPEIGQDDLDQNGWDEVDFGLELTEPESHWDDDQPEEDDEEVDTESAFQTVADHIMNNWYHNRNQLFDGLRDYEHHGGEIDDTDGYGDTFLHIACNASNGNCVTWLLDGGADPNIDNEEGHTPLFRAIYKNAQDCVIALVGDNNLEINWQNKDGLTALMFALDSAAKAHGTSYHMFSLVLEGGSDIDLERKDNRGETILFYVVKYADERDLKDILRLKPNVNVRSRRGLTPLILAVRRGRLDLVKMLVDAGADLEKQGKEAYEEAKYKGHQDVMNYLEEQGIT
jgi:ankyrin repeat protein